jgi:hypothetical protein
MIVPLTLTVMTARFLTFNQKEVDVESACGIQHLDSGIECSAFVGIGSSLCAFTQIKEKFGRACGLSHLVPFLPKTSVLVFKDT